MDGNTSIFTKLMSDDDFKKLVADNLLHQIYNNLRA
jgi:hypothetical protein